MGNFNQPPGGPFQPPQGGAPPPGGYGGPPPGGYGAPPPGGYGAPPQGGPSPYAPPMQYAPSTLPGGPVAGSFGLGFAAGFFGGCIGYLLVRSLAKGEETKKGARIGFIVAIAISAVIRVIGAASN